MDHAVHVLRDSSVSVLRQTICEKSERTSTTSATSAKRRARMSLACHRRSPIALG